MTEWTNEQRAGRIRHLMTQVGAVNATLQEIQKRVDALPWSIPRAQHGSRAKEMRAEAVKEYIEQAKILEAHRTEFLAEIAEHRKALQNSPLGK